MNTNWGLPFLSTSEYKTLCPRSKIIIIAIYSEWVENDKHPFSFGESLNVRIGELISEDGFTLETVPVRQQRLFTKLGLVNFNDKFSFIFKDTDSHLLDDMNLKQVFANGPKKPTNGPEKLANGHEKPANGPKKLTNGPRKPANGPEKSERSSPKRGVVCSKVPDHHGFERASIRRKRTA